MSKIGKQLELVGPVCVVALVALVGSVAGPTRALEIRQAIVAVAIVVALYVFVGNSGVLSFGQVSFVAVGAFASALMTIPVETKPSIAPGLFDVLKEHSVGNVASLVLAAALGGLYALAVGIPLMRLSGLSAGIATFAVLGITYNILRNWEKIGPGPQTLTTIPETTDLVQATLATVVVIAAAYSYQRSRLGRKLRAAREDAAVAQASGINVHRERLWAFVLSGVLSGFAGGVYVHLLGTLETRQVYLDLAFLTLAMLVVGGIASLWGAVVGALVVSGVDSLLTDAENGEVGLVNSVLGHPLWGGTRLVAVGVFMVAVLVFLPDGLTGGREFRLPRVRLHARAGESDGAG